ncbi:MAG TPA: phage tail tube protein [Jiangellales bacterium]|nr:phage tail tube protein [Jiangellales bacterium]
MATPVAYPSAKQFIGVSNEVTEGTVVTPLEATVVVNGFEPEDVFAQIIDEANRGDMAGEHGVTQGSGHVEWSIPESPAFYDTLPYFLLNLLGAIATTGAGPFTHVITLLNSGTGQPGFLDIFDWQGTPANSGRQYPAIAVSEITIKGSPEAEFITWSAKGVGWLSTDTAAAPTAAPSTDAPMPAWRAVISLAGTQNKHIGEWSVTITREVSVEHTSQNTQQPYHIMRGDLKVSGSLSVIKPADETELNYYLNNTQPELNITADNGGATTEQRAITLHMQLAAFTKSPIQRSEEAVGYNVDFKAVANATDAGASGGTSPIKITVINNTASGVYG